MIKNTDNRDTYSCELLAPAGSVESFKAAINAGADAVYIGGSMFGARAFADNPDEAALINCIDHAHLHGKKIYLTINTLLKNDEIIHQLYSYLKPYYKAGIDAVIVQDYGVLKFIREYFPDINIHASTQMTVTDSGHARLLKEAGVSRIVTARELSLEEIADIYKSTGLEIESFVHGALCYCYSGMCLFSSIAGGRSGNRGRCAQPCRMAYRVNPGYEHKSGLIPGKEKNNASYILSPKDLCALDILPDILEAGVYSLKIEGRMKKPEYVAAVVSVYRKYIDMLNAYGKEAYRPSESDKDIMLDIYNRGNFTDGYYKRHNSREMIAVCRPNHTGVAVLRKKGDGTGSAGAAIFDVIKDIGKNDVIEVGNTTITVTEDRKKGEKLSLKLPRGLKIAGDTMLYRVRNNNLIERLTGEYIKKCRKVMITGEFKATLENAQFTVRYGDISFSADISDIGGNVQKAVNLPTAADNIRKQLMKTGSTEFEFENLQIEIEGNIFISVKECNDLRRFAIEGLREKILNNYRRFVDSAITVNDIFVNNNAEDIKKSKQKKYIITCLISNEEQFDAVVNSPFTDRIYVELSEFTDVNLINGCAEKTHCMGKKIYIALPYIFRSDTEKYINGIIDEINKKTDGFLIRTLAEYMYLREKYGNPAIVFDYHIYAYNIYARSFLSQYSPELLTAPIELDCRELAALDIKGCELPVYGKLPLMVSAQCIRHKCGSKTPAFLEDRLKNSFEVRQICAFCYNIIYNGKPLSLLNVRDDVARLAPFSLRLDFISESKSQVSKIITDFYNVFVNDGEIPADFCPESYTKGHFKRKTD